MKSRIRQRIRNNALRLFLLIPLSILQLNILGDSRRASPYIKVALTSRLVVNHSDLEVTSLQAAPKLLKSNISEQEVAQILPASLHILVKELHIVSDPCTLLAKGNMGDKIELSEDDCRARYVALAIHTDFNPIECGLSGSIMKRLDLVKKGVGCCSDVADSFSIVSQLIGLPTRQVNSINHSFNEYYDRSTNTWKFIDPSLKSQFSLRDGALSSAEDLAVASPADNKLAIFFQQKGRQYWTGKQIYPGYNSFSTLVYTPEQDYISLIKAEQSMLTAGIPKELSQTLLLVTGVLRPSIIVTTTQYEHVWSAFGSILRIALMLLAALVLYTLSILIILFRDVIVFLRLRCDLE